MDYALYGKVLGALGFTAFTTLVVAYALSPSSFWFSYDYSFKGSLSRFFAYTGMTALVCLFSFLIGYPLTAFLSHLH